ncbi:isatin hydrolase-like [Physella acuta]|uniref:isatin hydrolase-like n=1 Tax=Physella acuta TaxID=109671 RepID=UPI0027DC52AA|nr:isatin hydrolase-like [Physella acuta]XP_059156915.1 isatin hydrolase-like [Physella acuta]XP_059156916.1 isatin hydrolase-like [Physella acuta]
MASSLTSLVLLVWLPVVRGVTCDEVVDLSHVLGPDSIFFPVFNLPFNLTVLERGQTADGYWFEYNKFDTLEHMGTHLDAPAHVHKGGWRVHEIPVSRLVGPGVVIDVRQQVKNNPDYRVTVADLQRYERRYGRIPDGAAVFMWSGWDVRYPDPQTVFNTPTPNDISTYHFPGFHLDAVNWLIKSRTIYMLGVDTPSIDFGQSRVFEVHQAFTAARILGLENVNNLGRLPASGATVVAAPVKLQDGSGVPIRILGLVPEGRTGLRGRAKRSSARLI